MACKIHGNPISIVCPCGGRGKDLRITSAYQGKIMIRCARCGHNRTLRFTELIEEPVPCDEAVELAALRRWGKGD